MKHVILLSPFSNKISTGQNPKNYPHWKEVVSGLRSLGHCVIQLGVDGEEDIGCNSKVLNASLKFILEMVKSCSAWASVDNFFPHLCQQVSKPGVVIWGQSNPKLFGYKTNTNLLKDEKYLRPNDQQYWLWTQTTYNADAFVPPETVIDAILKIAESNK